MKKILIVDYIIGGGFVEEDLPLVRLAESYSILRSTIEQFAQLGFEIATLIDHRLMQHIRISPIHEFKTVSSYEDFINGIKTFTDLCDYTITSAPETKGILKDLSCLISNSNSTYLGSKPDSIEFAADKLQTMKLARELNMSVPATFSPNFNDPFDKIADEVSPLGFPLIVKPIDGVGCQGLTKVNSIKELRYGLRAANAMSGMDNCIVQEFIKGIPISTSLFANGETVVPISINHQNLKIESKHSTGDYLGGSVPLNLGAQNEKVLNISKELISHLDLKGFVGVDFVVTKKEIFVIEVNPRITVPFVALSSLATENLAEKLLAVVEGKPITPVKLNGYAYFSKLIVESIKNKLSRFELVSTIDGVLTPPLPINNNSHTYVFLMGLGKTAESARKDFQKIKSQVLAKLSS